MSEQTGAAHAGPEASALLRKELEDAPSGPWWLEWQGQDLLLLSQAAGDPIAEWTFAIRTWEPEAAEDRADCDTAAADLILTAVNTMGAVLELLDLLGRNPSQDDIDDAHQQIALAILGAHDVCDDKAAENPRPE